MEVFYFSLFFLSLFSLISLSLVRFFYFWPPPYGLHLRSFYVCVVFAFAFLADHVNSFADFFVQELATYFSAKDSDEMVANRKHILRTHPSAEVSSPECMVDRIVRSLYEASFISSSNTIEVFKLFLDLLDVAPAAFVPSSLLALHSVLLFGATFMTTELLTESLEVFYQYMYSVDVDVHNIAERCFHLSWQALASGGHPLVSILLLCLSLFCSHFLLYLRSFARSLSS